MRKNELIDDQNEFEEKLKRGAATTTNQKKE